MEDLTTHELKELIAMNIHWNSHGQFTEQLVKLYEELESRKQPLHNWKQDGF
jgi:hypothetical protein